MSKLIEKFGLPTVLFFALMILGPIAIYAYKFQFGLWEKNADWGALGGYLSGIYSPMAVGLTLYVLVRQQDHSEKVIEVNQQREDLNFLLTRLDTYLHQTTAEDGVVLHEWFKKELAFSDNNKLKSQQDLLRAINAEHLVISTTWYAVWLLLTDILESDSKPQHKNMSETKVVTILSYDTCVALDKFLYSTQLEKNIAKKDLHFWS
ncbi:hypothetical protein [Vibrio echinoideorum]|uniref:hypothetical protein n=1 Tax=Vibrio echinoideorum TaxID=2100116 RepID=UPI001080DE6E|nr:hypothetical protein [Vibrio echinoideorum]